MLYYGIKPGRCTLIKTKKTNSLISAERISTELFQRNFYRFLAFVRQHKT